MIMNGAPITSGDSQIASTAGTGTAVDSNARSRRASRTTSWAPGGRGGRGGRRSTTSHPSRRIRKVAFECPPTSIDALAGPDPMRSRSR
jgi:hypothetical protein